MYIKLAAFWWLQARERSDAKEYRKAKRAWNLHLKYQSQLASESF